MKLLLVDNDPEVQQWVETHLGKEGFEVSVYGDGLSALDMFAVVEPDVILANLNLPGMNIFRFCNKLRQKTESKSLPILLLVKPGEEMDEARLRSAGVVDFVSLPMKLADVTAKIKPHVSGQAEPAPAPAPSEAPPAAAKPAAQSAEQVEGLKIEELLGWSPAGEKAEASNAPAPETAPAAAGEEDRTVIAGPSGLAPAPDQGSAEPEAAESREPEEKTVVMAAPETPAAVSAAKEPSTESTLISGSMAELSELASAAGDKVRPPSAAPAADSPTADPQAIEAAVNRVVREVVEKIAWEVVPTIAESLIKEELEKLKSNKPE